MSPQFCPCPHEDQHRTKLAHRGQLVAQRARQRSSNMHGEMCNVTEEIWQDVTVLAYRVVPAPSNSSTSSPVEVSRSLFQSRYTRACSHKCHCLSRSIHRVLALVFVGSIMWWSSKLSLANIAILCLLSMISPGALVAWVSLTKEAADHFESGMIEKVAMTFFTVWQSMAHEGCRCGTLTCIL